MRGFLLAVIAIVCTGCPVPFVDTCEIARRTAAKTGQAFTEAYDKFDEEYQEHLVIATPPDKVVPAVLAYAKVNREIRAGLRSYGNALTALGEAIEAYRKGKGGDLAGALGNLTAAALELAKIIERHKVPVRPPSVSWRPIDSSPPPLVRARENGSRRVAKAAPALTGGSS